MAEILESKSAPSSSMNKARPVSGWPWSHAAGPAIQVVGCLPGKCCRNGRSLLDPPVGRSGTQKRLQPGCVLISGRASIFVTMATWFMARSGADHCPQNGHPMYWMVKALSAEFPFSVHSSTLCAYSERCSHKHFLLVTKFPILSH